MKNENVALLGFLITTDSEQLINKIKQLNFNYFNYLQSFFFFLTALVLHSLLKKSVWDCGDALNANLAANKTTQSDV